MNDRQLLIHNLYREFEKEKWKIQLSLLSGLNTATLITRKGNFKISMVIKIEKEEN